MKKRTIQIVLFLMFMMITLSSKAQFDYAAVDSNSYKLYYYQQWTRLIEYGDSAIDNGTDYMFLRQRIGIAHFSLEDYRMASYNFEKALTFNSDDDFTLYYLYYSYLYSGRQSDANLITQNMTENMKNSLKWKKKYLSSVDLETGLSLSNNIQKNGNLDFDGLANIYGESNMSGNLNYYHIGLKHEVLPFLSFYQCLNKITISNQKVITYDRTISHAKDSLVDTINNYKVNQFEYYINSDIQLSKSLKLTTAFHYIHVGFNSIDSQTSDSNKFLEIVTKTTTLNNYVVSFDLTKEFKLTSMSLFATKSNLNGLNQFVFGTNLKYFPLGNLNFYSSSTLSCILEKGNLNGNPQRWIFDQIIGTKLFSRLWGEASVTFGDLTNFNEKDAFLVYNTFDNIKLKTGVSLLYSLSSKIDLSLRYQFIMRQDVYITDLNNSHSSQLIEKQTITNYINNAIIGGIKWKL